MPYLVHQLFHAWTPQLCVQNISHWVAVPLLLCTCNFKENQKLATKEERGTQTIIQFFSICPTPCEKPRIPCSTVRAPFSQLQPETGRWCVQKSYPSEPISNIFPQAGVGKAPIRVFKYPLICTQTLKSPPGVSLNGKLGEKRQDPELFLLLWKRLGTARLAASQSVQQENQSLERETDCGFPSSISNLESLLRAPLVECLWSGWLFYSKPIFF